MRISILGQLENKNKLAFLTKFFFLLILLKSWFLFVFIPTSGVANSQISTFMVGPMEQPFSLTVVHKEQQFV